MRVNNGKYHANKNNELKQKLNKIRQYTDGNQFSIALQLLNELNEEFSNNPYYIFEMGIYYYRLRDYDKALEYFESLENSKNKYHAIYYIGVIKLQKKDSDGAIEEFTKIIESDHPNKEYAQIEIAEVYRHKREPDMALELLSVVIEWAIANDNQRIYITAIINKAGVLMDKKEYDMARDLVNSVLGQIKRRDLLNKAIYALANIEYENEEFDNCQKYLNKISDDYIPKKMLEAKLLYMQNNYVKSKSICQSLYDDPYFYLDAYALNAKNNIGLKLYDEAKQELEKVIHKDKINSILYYDLGLLHFQRQDFEKSLEYFEYIIENISYMKNSAIQKSIYANIKLKRIQAAYDLYIKFVENDIFKDDPKKEIQLRAYFSKYIPECQPCVSNFYSYKQISDYNEEEALSHIRKHHYDINQADKERHTLFSNEINIRQLFNYAKNNISQENFYDNNFFDEYVIKYSDCTLDIDNSMKELKVITIPNTNDIITMYPCRVYETAIGNKEEFVGKPYVKVSQVDKFKKRYGMK